MRRHRAAAGTLGLTAVLLLGACSPGLPGQSSRAGRPTSAGPTPPPIAASASPYRASAARRTGGTVTIGTWQFPTQLSPYFAAQSAATPVDSAIYDGLVGLQPDLGWYGDLAAQVPTAENGGVRRVGDGMDVTYELRPGLHWSDGQPITAADVVFTYQVITGPGASAGVGQDGYDHISAVDAHGDGEVVVHFRSVFAAYLDLFSAILPAHRLAGVAASALAADGYWKQPDVVSGPFAVERVSDGQIVLRRNPRYADGRAGMPILGHPAHLDGLVFQAFESRQAVIAAVKADDAQLGVDLTERELRALNGLSGVSVALTPSLAYEQVSLNQSNPNSASGQAPPWVGDPAVGQALDLALDRPALKSRLLPDLPLTATPLSALVGWAYDAQVPAPAYDLDAAKRLLDGDGWNPGADGVRTKDGRRLAFTLAGASGQPLRAIEQDVLAAGWRKLGADVRLVAYPQAQLFGSYEQGGVLARGGYDAAIWSWVTPPDPDSEFDLLHSAAVPAAGSVDSQNFSRCHDASIDQALTAGRSTVDLARRADAYREFQHAYVAAHCELPLYRRLDIGVTSPRLHNFALNPGPAGNTWNVDDWWV